MSKNFISSSVIVFFVAIFFGYLFSPSNYEPKMSLLPPQKDGARPTLTATKSNKNIQQPDTEQSALPTTKAVVLLPVLERLAALEERFDLPYPDKESILAARRGDKITPSEKELSTRTFLLKKFERDYPWPKLAKEERDQVKEFYEKVLLNEKEHPFVRAQAMRNLKVWRSSLNRREKLKLDQQVPLVIRSLAARTDREIAEAFFE